MPIQYLDSPTKASPVEYCRQTVAIWRGSLVPDVMNNLGVCSLSFFYRRSDLLNNAENCVLSLLNSKPLTLNINQKLTAPFADERYVFLDEWSESRGVARRFCGCVCCPRVSSLYANALRVCRAGRNVCKGVALLVELTALGLQLRIPVFRHKC